jgi:pyruvoyl-dependent arginine decarboxylase
MEYTTADSYYLACGAGAGETQLEAYDASLCDAGVGDLNFLFAGTILPPGIPGVDELPAMPAGSFVPAIVASVRTSEPSTTVYAAVAVALPRNSQYPAVVMSDAGSMSPGDDPEAKVREMASRALEARGHRVQEIVSTSKTAETGDTGEFTSVVASVLLLGRYEG